MMSEASWLQSAGILVFIISKTTEPSAFVIFVERVAHSTESQTFSPVVVNRLVIFIGTALLPCLSHYPVLVIPVVLIMY